jgi:RHS repeat-associated protein
MNKLMERALACVLLALHVSTSLAADVGRTAGSFDVSPSGAATYSIPIWTPPGPNGLTPSISLDYSSQGTNGLVGVGWNLSATTAIERCNRTVGQDGFAAAVELSMNDRYCMGGKRLRLDVNNGTYGAPNSIYFTEIMDFSRIKAYGSFGYGPEYFVVEAKNGLKFEYGRTADSRVVLGGTVLRWMLNKVYQRNGDGQGSGNNYVIVYDNTSSPGFAVPQKISWTPTFLGSTAYSYEAVFNFNGGRTPADSYSGKVAGFDVSNSRRLDNIQIKSAGTVIRKYVLAYDATGVTSRSRLTSVKECSDDIATTNCLPPTTMTYQSGVLGVTPGAGTAPAGSSNGFLPGRYDLNGDGKDDFLYMISGTCYAAFGANTGFAGPYNVGTTSCGIVDRFLPNGRDGIAVAVSGTFKIYRWNDASSAFSYSESGVPAGSGVAYAADYDADGLADLITHSNTQIFVRRNTSSAASPNPAFASSAFLGATLPGSAFGGTPRFGGLWTYFGKGLQRADLNGDGRQDIYAAVVVDYPMGGSVGYLVTLQAWSSGYIIPATNTWAVGAAANPAINFNGDACTDRVVGSTILISQCNGIATTSLATPAIPQEFLDWNGDGRTDILVNAGGNLAVYLSIGTGFSGSSVTNIASSGVFVALDLDGDRQEDLVRTNGTSAISYWTHTAAGAVPASATNVVDLLSSVSDGFGVTYAPAYASTAWGINYQKVEANPYPLQEADPQIVTERVTASNGIGGTLVKTYYYVGAKVDSARQELAGFERLDEIDTRNGLISRTHFANLFPYGGLVVKQELMQANGATPIQRTITTYNSDPLGTSETNRRYFVFPTDSVFTQFEVGGTWNGSLLRTTTTLFQFETVGGTLYEKLVSTSEPSSANGVNPGGTWVHKTYIPPADLINNTNTWCLGRPGKIEQINSSNRTFGTELTRTSSVAWDVNLCRPTSTTVEPGIALAVTTAIGYDAFGNVNSTTVSGSDFTTRSSSSFYGDAATSSGQFPLTITNALGHVTDLTWNYNLAVPIDFKDPNDLFTGWQYDAYGRRTQEDRPDGTFTTFAYVLCPTGCGPLVRMYINQTEYSSGAELIGRQYLFFDQFDRGVFESVLRTAGGNYTATSRTFDSLGRNVSESIPVSTPAEWTGEVTTTYDILDRPIAISRPKSDTIATLQTTTISYEGLTTRVTDPQDKNSWKVTNAIGQLARSKDHDGNYQSFDYDPFGNPKQVTNSLGNTLQSSTYNIRGMLTQRTDMEMGTWNFTPNALGETISQTDAENRTTLFSFDKLGRLISRTDHGAAPTYWTWDSYNGTTTRGRLMRVAATSPNYSETYEFDSLSRLSRTTISADTNYQIDYSYNDFSALDTLTYPTSTSGFRLKLKYAYAYGRLTQVRECADSPCTSFGTTYWTGNAFSALEQVTSETLGNGLSSNRPIDKATGLPKSIQTGVAGGSGVQNLAYEWDLVGNLKKRIDNNQSGLTEEFFYDNLYRLDESRRNGTKNQDLAYDALGNITSKMDVGNYTYHASKKHQLVSTSNGWSFGYDNNGNMTSGRGATITWTTFNRPLTITNGGNVSTFSYAPDRQYWKQQSTYAAGGESTSIYIGGILEKVTTGGNADFRHMIRAGNSTIIVSRKVGGTNSVSYLTSDHLGSSSAITNSSGALLVNSSFDAFGKRRGANWSGTPSAADLTTIAATTRRGYTEHSMLDNLNLTHMNGRVYDQMLGRFLSADPFIPEPLNTQSYNRYSYVFNNPLSFTDPSGFDPDGVPRFPGIPGFWPPNEFPPCSGGIGSPCEPGEQPEPGDWAGTGKPVDIPAPIATWSGIKSVAIAVPYRTPSPQSYAASNPTSQSVKNKFVQGYLTYEQDVESEYIMLNPGVQQNIKAMAVDANSAKPKREMGALSVYEQGGAYQVYSDGTPVANKPHSVNIRSVDPSRGRHVLDIHYHPTDRIGQASDADIAASGIRGSPGVVIYNYDPSTDSYESVKYVGVCKNPPDCAK